MNALLRSLFLLTLAAVRTAAITVSGTVTTDGGAPLAGVTLTIEQVGGELPPLTATTAASGTWSVSDPFLFGNVRVTAAKSGFTFNPAVRDSFASVNLPGQNFTAISTGQIQVNVGSGGGSIPRGTGVLFDTTVVPAGSTLSFRLRNTGTGPLTGLAVTFSGPSAAAFSVTTPPPTALAAGSTADFIVTAAPQSVGVHTAVMHVASSDSNENPFDLNLSAPAYASLTVSNVNDSGPGSLREALVSAAAKPGFDRILFEPQVFGKTITLTNELTVSDPPGVLIAPRPDGPGVPLYQESFDNSDGGWTVTSSRENYEGPWFYHAPLGMWWVNGQNTPTNVNSSTRLASPGYVIPQSGEVVVSFRHRHEFEADYDGGQFQVQGVDGNFQTIYDFLENGYNGTLASAELPGQPAFVDRSPGAIRRERITSRALVGHFEAGQILHLQFVAHFDTSYAVGFPAWEIDDVSIAVLPEGLPGITLAGGPGTNRLIYNSAGSSLVLDRITLTGGRGSGAGHSPGGGAMFNQGYVTLANCTFYNNSSGAGGHGGAVYNSSDALATITRCTFNGNICPAGRGGALYNGGGMYLTHCTIAGNTAQRDGGGLENEQQTEITNCILSGNTLTDGTANELHAKWTIITAGTNIVQSMTRIGSGLDDGGLLLNVDPLLSPLMDCGGPTPTMAIRPGSWARDLTLEMPSLNDQRGFRLVRTPDIGAYESLGTDTNFNAYIQERLPADATDAQRHPQADFDHDGQSNETEWLARTAPADPGSRFEPVTEMTAAGFRVNFPSAWGRTYSLLESDSLAPGMWVPVPGIPILTGNNAPQLFTVPVSTARRFYQIAPAIPH